MKRLAALALCAMTLPPAAAADPPRKLSQADDEWVTKKYDEALAFGRAGKWGHDEAQAPVREIVARCTAAVGKDHHLTAYYEREIDYLKKLVVLPQADRLEYMKTYPLYEAMSEHWKKEQYTEGLVPAEHLLTIYRRILGPDAYYTAVAASWYGELLNYTQRYTEGETQLLDALRIYRKIVGEDHASVAQVHLYLGQLRTNQGRYADAEKHLRDALKIYLAVVGEDHAEVAQVYLYLAPAVEKQARYADARRLYEAHLEVSTRVRGEGHPWTGVASNNLAAYLERQALYRDAEQVYRRSVKTLEAAGDKYSTLLATAYANLAVNLQHQARYDAAEEMLRQAFAIRRRLKEDGHTDMGRLYMHLAANRADRGNYAAAEPLYRKTVASFRKGYGENSADTAWALNNLAVNLDNQGRFKEGEALLLEAIATVRRAPGDSTWAAAKMSNNLATCLRSQKRYAESRALCEQALADLRRLLGPNHTDVASVLNNVAAGLEDEGRYAEAEPKLREALEVMERLLTVDHPDVSFCRLNLGTNLYHQGKFDEADRQYRQALADNRRIVGEGHPATAWAYKSVVGNCCARGDYAAAEAVAVAATASFEAARLRFGFAGLDRAGSAANISPLPSLAVAAARRRKPLAAWQALERDLARGLLDDLSARRVDDADRQREQALLDQLALLDQRIAVLRTGGAASDADRKKHEIGRDAKLAELVQFREKLAAKYDVGTGRVYDLDHIQKRLPDDAALLAWVDLGTAPKWDDPKGDHWACLVRHRGEPVWVQLPGSGPDRGWTDGDERLAARTRRAVAARPDGRSGEWKELATQLAAQRLGPLESDLKSAPDRPAVRHLIVLPSPEMAGIPLDALPGVAERFTVTYAPSGTMFAWLQERGAGPAPRGGRLLAVGDPAFPPPREVSAAAGADAPPSADRREAFSALPGTNAELSGVARVFRTKRVLTGSDASEQDLDQLAADDRLRDYRYLHFATHGVLDDQRPMRSALILAQDRLPDPSTAVTNGKPLYDGRLTAERILRRWTLDADLVTLSACDTGLGRFTGGEGHLGFSQALFLAGARSLVLSLWEVDDASTALLMTRFYENLTGEGTGKPMPKAEALAEAKRWLRGLGADEVGQLTKDLSSRGTRGRVVDRQPAGDVQLTRTFEHPYFWSGFVLIGDPR